MSLMLVVSHFLDIYSIAILLCEALFCRLKFIFFNNSWYWFYIDLVEPVASFSSQILSIYLFELTLLLQMPFHTGTYRLV